MLKRLPVPTGKPNWWTTIGSFRNQPQLDALRRIVIPKTLPLKLVLPQRRLRIWSAGCLHRREPYTLRILAFVTGSSRFVHRNLSQLDLWQLQHAAYREKYFLPTSCK